MVSTARACASVAASAANESSVAPQSAGFTGGYMLPRLSPLRQGSPIANTKASRTKLNRSLNGIAISLTTAQQRASPRMLNAPSHFWS
jgi:hypothetical protein